MKSVIAIVVIVSAVALGLYWGGWVCFIGGIVDVIGEVKASVTLQALSAGEL